MMVSTKGRYALKVMLDLATCPREEYISLKAISERQAISMKYLEAIVASLSKAELVESLRGKTGGYRLNKSLDAYRVGDILRAAEGELSVSNCMAEEGGCEKAGECLTMPLWRELDKIVSNYLDSVTLKDLLENKL